MQTDEEKQTGAPTQTDENKQVGAAKAAAETTLP